MATSTIIYQANQEVFGRHHPTKVWVMYSGKLTIYDRQLNPVVLSLKSEIIDSFICALMEDKIEFKADSVTEVYAKVAKWYRKSEIQF